MKKLLLFLIVLVSCIVLDVEADSLVFGTNNVSGENLVVDVKVSDATNGNNVYEGLLTYKDNVSNVSIVNEGNWEIYTKEVKEGIKFIVFNMNDVAINDTVLFKVSMNFKDTADISVSKVGSANGISGLGLADVVYSYKKEVVKPPVVNNNTNSNGGVVEQPTTEDVVLPQDTTNNIEEVEQEESEEKKEDKKESKKTPWWIAIPIIVVVAGAGIVVARKETGGAK